MHWFFMLSALFYGGMALFMMSQGPPDATSRHFFLLWAVFYCGGIIVRRLDNLKASIDDLYEDEEEKN
jgi:hypothetical protein